MNIDSSLNMTSGLKYGFGSAFNKFENHFSLNPSVVGPFRTQTECIETANSPFYYAVQAARRIADLSLGKKVTLALSSGVDSQAMLAAFIEAKVNFEIAVMDYYPEFNRFDTEFIFKLCRDLKYPIRKYTLDIDKFFMKDKLHIDYHRKYRIHLAGLATHLWLIDQIEGPVVFSGNPPSIGRVRNKTVFNMPSDAYFCYERYFAINKRQGTGHFFLSTRELINSFINLPLMKGYTENLLTYDYDGKVKVYQQGGFSVIPQKAKFHGFEEYMKYFEVKYKLFFPLATLEDLRKIDPFVIDEAVSYTASTYLVTQLELV